jgi:Flp pilus assembly protein TadD
MVKHLLRTDRPFYALAGRECGIVGIRVQIYSRGVMALAVAGLLLGGCQSKTASLDADPMSTASTSVAGPSFKKTEALSKQWKSDLTQVNVAIAYGESLDQLGQKPTQIDVLRSTVERTKSNAQAQADLGRALLKAGDIEGATGALSTAVALNPRDAQALSALGATLDQQTKHVEAREKYMAALAIAPDNLGVMNNLAMSYSLQGKLPEAETTLRKAMTHPDAKTTPRIRQNLALVVGLQGRFDEAKQIASEDLPPDQVAANMAYLQQMLASNNTWAKLKQDPAG